MRAVCVCSHLLLSDTFRSNRNWLGGNQPSWLGRGGCYGGIGCHGPSSVVVHSNGCCCWEVNGYHLRKC